jgi:PAS domain S-box-containing protein
MNYLPAMVKVVRANANSFQRASNGRIARRAVESRAQISPAELLWPEMVKELAAIVEYSNDAVFSRRLDGTIATWNAAAERIFGYKAEEAIGRKSGLFLPPGRRDEFHGLLKRIRRGEVVEQFETERRCKDGRCIAVSLTLSPVRDASGELIGFSTIARDITEQRRAREALERSERALNDLFEGASVGLLWTTPRGRVLRANQAMLDLLECEAVDCVGLALSRFRTQGAGLGALLKRLASRETLHNFPATLRTKTGQAREVLIDAGAFCEGGGIVHLRWFVRDITLRKQLEREVLAISERERSAFSRELHDSLGQQLSGIRYLTNVLRDRLREAGSPEAEEAERIFNLLKQALEQARAVAHGLAPVRPEPEGLAEALRELAAQSSGIFRIKCQFCCPTSMLVCDTEAATHLYRIAQEAVHNAIRHGQAREIIISLTRTREQVRLRIADNGKGIETLSPRRKGMGLRIMQYRGGLLQGTVSISRRPGGGTEVCCVAPAKVLQAEGRNPRVQ